MVHWINSHGIEAILIYLAISAIAGSIPPLPPTAGFWATWGYAFLHAVSMNLRQAAQALNLKIPTGAEEK